LGGVWIIQRVGCKGDASGERAYVRRGQRNRNLAKRTRRDHQGDRALVAGGRLDGVAGTVTGKRDPGKGQWLIAAVIQPNVLRALVAPTVNCWPKSIRP